MNRTCQNCKIEFKITPEDIQFYERIQVPPPTWCWRCRAMRRMLTRDMTHLYPRICAATGKKIYVSMPPEAPMPVYDFKYWISDAWDPLEYGREYDFSRPFFDQIRDLYNTVPWTMLWSFDSINSDYSSAAWAKNCYLCFDAGFLEDCAYGVSIQRSKQCVDMVNSKLCELCYYSINLNHSFRTFFSRNCVSCIDVWFSQDCSGCNNCFGCSGLRNKSYYIFNQPYSKEEYEKKIKEMNLHTWTGLQKARREAEAAWLGYPVKFQHSIKAEGCSGDYLFNASGLRNCFFSDGAQDCAHSQSIIYAPIKDSMDVSSSGENLELCYETIEAGDGLAKSFFSSNVGVGANVQYSINCNGGNNLFGCVGIRKKDYSVLNKQYTKEEFNSLVPKIIQHMNDMPYVDERGRVYKYGEFFPPNMSPHGYNETQAQEYFPLTKKQAEEYGFKWAEREKNQYEVTKNPGDLPDSISEVGDDILKEVIQCGHTGKNEHPFDCAPNCAGAFRLALQELKFYRDTNLPLPRTCFYCRHFDRVAWRNKPALYKRTCMCGGENAYKNHNEHFHGVEQCPNEFETTYAPDRAEIVYCENCYQQETQ